MAERSPEELERRARSYFVDLDIKIAVAKAENADLLPICSEREPALKRIQELLVGYECCIFKGELCIRFKPGISLSSNMTPVSRREAEYRSRVDLLVIEWASYTAEGKTVEAAEKALQIKALKADIRKAIPDIVVEKKIGE
jgi:hypothetical protein